MKGRKYQKKLSLYGRSLEQVVDAVLKYKPKPKKKPKKKFKSQKRKQM